MTIVLAVGALAFILWSMTDYQEKCKTQDLDICDAFKGSNFSLLVLTLVLAGLVLISSTVLYILTTA